MSGVCGCITPPTRPGDRCNACGYTVPYFTPGPVTYTSGLTADDVRRIVREELAQAKASEEYVSSLEKRILDLQRQLHWLENRP